MEKTISAQDKLLKEQSEMIELLGKRVSVQIQKEIKKATAHLRGSSLEKDANGGKEAANKVNVSAKGGISDADMKEIEILVRDKANKFDVEMSLR